MKKYFFVNLFAFLLPFTMQAGHGSGNGGAAWVCRNADGSIRWAELVDTWEARNEFGLTLRESGNSEEEYIRESLVKIAELSEPMYLAISTQLDKVRANIEHVPVKEKAKKSAKDEIDIDQAQVNEIHDANYRIVPVPSKTCSNGTLKVENVANYAPYGKILIDDEILLAIKPLSAQYNILLHEAISAYYREAPELAQTSDKARRLVGLTASTKSLWEDREQIIPGKMGEAVPAGACIERSLAPTYDLVGDASNGYMTLKSRGQKGADALLDSDGGIHTRPDDATMILESVNENLIAAESFDERYGFVNNDMKWVIPPKWGFVNEFHNGYAVVSTADDLYGVIDITGKVVIKPQFTGVSDDIGTVVTEGLIRVATSSSRPDPDLPRYREATKFGYVDLNFDQTKHWVIKPEWDYASQGFHHGIAVVAKNDKYGIIRRNGTFLLPPTYSHIAQLNDTMYKVTNSNKKTALFDENGTDEKDHWKSAFQFDDIEAIGGTRYGLKQGDKWGIYDIATGFTVLPKFQEIQARLYKDPLVRVKEKGKYGFINRDGETIIEALFAKSDFFFNKVAVISESESDYGLINRAGRVIVPFGTYIYISSPYYATSMDDWIRVRVRNPNGEEPEGAIKIKRSCIF